MEQINKSNLTRQFFKYTMLNIISMLGLSFYIIADTLIIAASTGNDGLTALNLALPVFSVISASGQMIAMGASALFSAYKGNGNTKGANRIFTVGLYFACVISLIFLVMGLFFSRPLCSLLGADDSVIELTNGYLQIMLLFGPAFILNNLFTYFVRNDNSPKLAMCAMLVSTLSNVVLDLIFVFSFGMGIQGASLATGIAPLLSLAVLSTHFLFKKNSFKPDFHIPDFRKFVRVSAIGSPVFVTEISFGIIMLAINYTVLGLTGNVGVAAYSIISNVALAAKSFFSGIAQGIQPLTSYFTGKNDTASIRKLCRMGIVMTSVTGVIVFTACIILKDPLIAIFNVDNDAEMARIAGEGVPLYFPAFIIMGINMLAEVFFSSVQQPGKSFFVSVMRGLAVILIMIWILPTFLGMAGVWISVPVTEGIVCVYSLTVMLLWGIKAKNVDKLHENYLHSKN